jgi:FkbM family methyltransferase
LPNIVFIREVGPFQWIFRTGIRQFYKRVLKREHKMRLPTGEWITIPIDSRGGSEVFITGGNVDWGSEKLLYSLIGGNGVFLDVGANIGYYSLYFAPKVSSVFSFEPDPRVRLSLERNVRNKSKIEVIPYAVGATEGKARFVLEQDSEISHLSAIGGDNDKQIEVEVTTIDAFVAARRLKVEAIKIDAEGHDIEVIKGALTTLTEQKPVVLMECEPDTDLFRIARKLSYRVFAYARQPETRKRFFTELLLEVPTPGNTKMIFLVPDGLAENIMTKALTC